MKTKLFSMILLLMLGIGLVSAQEHPMRGERWGNRARPMERFQNRQFGQQRQRPMERMQGRQFGQQPQGPMAILQKLNLTDEQKDAVQKIHSQAFKDLKPLRDQLRELEAHHLTLSTAEKPDMKKIDECIEKIGAVKIQVAKIQAKQQLDFRALLNEEQIQKLDMAKERPFNKQGHFRRG